MTYEQTSTLQPLFDLPVKVYNEYTRVALEDSNGKTLTVINGYSYQPLEERIGIGKFIADNMNCHNELLEALESSYEALRTCRNEIDSASHNMIANGYEKHAMPIKMLSHASLFALETMEKCMSVIAKARGQS